MSERLTNLDNRKISPNGVITLPFVARVALGFEKGRPQFLTAETTGGAVVLTAADSGGSTVKASPKGLVQLPVEAQKALGGNRYRVSVDEQSRRVVLSAAGR